MGAILLIDAVAAPALVAIGDGAGPVRLWRASPEVSAPVAQPVAGLLRDALEAGPDQRRRIRRVAAAIGPGAFTGVRAAAAMARGVALALGVRSVGVDGFSAMAAHLALDLGRRGVWGLAFGSEARPVWRLVDLDTVEPTAAPETIGRALGPLRTDAIALSAAEGWAGAHPALDAISAARRAPPNRLLALAAAAPADAPRAAPFYGRAPDAAPSRHTPPARLPAG